MSSIPGWGRSAGEGHAYPLQYSCLENLMDRGAWPATDHRVAKSWTRLRMYTLPVKLCVLGEKKKSLSCVRLFATIWTLQSMEFSRPEYRSGWLFPSPGDLPDPGIERTSSASQTDSLPAEPPGKPMFFPTFEKCTLRKTGFGGKVGLAWASPNLL